MCNVFDRIPKFAIYYRDKKIHPYSDVYAFLSVPVYSFQ